MQQNNKEQKQEQKAGETFGKSCFYAGVLAGIASFLFGSWLPLLIYAVCVVVGIIMAIAKKRQEESAKA